MDVPHLALPLRVVDGAFAAVEQGSLDELTVSVQVVCSFPIGYRIESPEFGIPEFELSDLPLPVDDLERTIESWEPRANVEVTQADYNPNDPLAAPLQVAVTMPNEED